MFSIAISIVAILISVYSYCTTSDKIDRLDDAVFEYMKEEHNARVSDNE